MKACAVLKRTMIVLVCIALLSNVKASQPAHAAGPWYVAPAPVGNDSNNCLGQATPCATINGAIGKASSGDTIYVAVGTYTGSGNQVVLIDKDTILSGGWNSMFTTQVGTSTIDGQEARPGVLVNENIIVSIDRFTVQNGSSMNGGGIINGGTLTLNNSTVSGNTCVSYGGGILGSNLTLNNSIVSNNTAYEGGGISNDGGTVTLNNSIVKGNEARSRGGGIRNYFGTVILNNSTVSGNTTSGDNRDMEYAGGGIYNWTSILILNNSTVSGNTASGEGGGIYHNTFGGGVSSMTVSNSTISDNKAGQGGGIYGEGSSITMQNTIIAGNAAEGSGPDCDCWGNISSAGYNLIGNLSGCSFTSGPGDLVNVIPGLGLSEGYPSYHPLLPDSPAINAGNPAGCTDHLGNPIITDQRGFPRFGRCDIGAYELQPIGFSTKNVSPSTVQPGSPLTYTIALTNGGTAVIANVRVTDTLPVSLTYRHNSLVATSGSYGYNGGIITWTGSISVGGSVTITFGAAVNPTTSWYSSIVNSATISGGGEILARTASFLILPYYVYAPCVNRNYCPVIEADDFSDPGTGWPVVDTGNALYEYLNGEYRILVKTTNRLAGVRTDVLASDYIAAVDVRNANGVYGFYGISFGLAEDWSQRYLFGIDPDGYYVLWRHQSGPGWTPLAWGQSGYINTGLATNRLKVERSGTSIRVYANGHLLASLSDGSFTGPRHVGITVSSYDWPNVDVRFDNWVVYPAVCGAVNVYGASGAGLSEKWASCPNDSRIGIRDK